jgi:hypothetical protein
MKKEDYKKLQEVADNLTVGELLFAVSKILKDKQKKEGNSSSDKYLILHEDESGVVMKSANGNSIRLAVEYLERNKITKVSIYD